LSKDVTKEEITVLTEIFRLGAILTLAVSGGTISLILGERTTLKNTFAVAGFIATVVLGMLLYRFQLHIRRLIAQIREDQP
jgi:hypothetical protein